MTSDAEILAQLVEYHDHIAVPPTAVQDDVRRGRRRVRRRRVALAGVAALAVAAVAVGGTLIDRDWLVDGVRPVGPAPTAPSPLPTASASPSATAAAWTGPLRPGVSLRWVSPSPGQTAWADPADAAIPGVDIASVRQDEYQRLSWIIALRTPPRGPAARHAAGQVLEYGLVADTDGDRVADCEIAIKDDERTAGVFRVRVQNLKTGESVEQVGPPYGRPVEFSHPDETSGDPMYVGTQMHFVFLTSTMEPCERFARAGRYYAWASLTDSGQVVAWDFAPDAGWLRMRS